MPVDDWKIAEPFRAPFGAYPTNRNIFSVKKSGPMVDQPDKSKLNEGATAWEKQT